MSIPILKYFLEFSSHFLRKLDHGLDVGEHVPFLILTDEILSSERFFNFFLDGDEVIMVVTFCGDELLESIEAIFSPC